MTEELQNFINAFKELPPGEQRINYAKDLASRDPEGFVKIIMLLFSDAPADKLIKDYADDVAIEFLNFCKIWAHRTEVLLVSLNKEYLH